MHIQTKRTYVRPQSDAINIEIESHLLTDISNIGTDGGDVDTSDKTKRMNPIWGDE